MKTFSSSVLLLLALSWFMSRSLVSAKHHIYIINFLDVNTSLTVRCQSKDNDLGTHQLSFGGNLNWSFNINIWRTTLFYCDMSWDNVKGRFDVFVAKRDAHRCSENKCFWEVQKDGLYLYIVEHDQYERQFAWPNSINE